MNLMISMIHTVSFTMFNKMNEKRKKYAYFRVVSLVTPLTSPFENDQKIEQWKYALWFNTVV